MKTLLEDFGTHTSCVKYFNGLTRAVKINIVLKAFGTYF